MHPYIFEMPLPWGGTFRAASYGFMILCGFLLCLWLFQRRGRRMGLEPMALFDLAVLALLGGIIGARGLYVLYNWEEFTGNLVRVIRLDKGGLSFFGALIGGLTAMLLSIRKKKLPLRTTLDVAASLLPLGHAFGRMGCFLNGCCFGNVTDAWVGLRFPRILDKAGAIIGSPPFLQHIEEGLVTTAGQWSLPVHPTQLYEAGYNLAFFAILSRLLPQRHRPGQVAWLYLVLYGAGRFVNEFFRADTVEVAGLGGLTLFQGLAFLGLLIGFVLFLDTMRRPALPMPEPWAPPHGGNDEL